MNELSWSFNHLASWWPFSSSNGRSYIVDLFNFWLALGRPSSISSFFCVVAVVDVVAVVVFAGWHWHSTRLSMSQLVIEGPQLVRISWLVIDGLRAISFDQFSANFIFDLKKLKIWLIFHRKEAKIWLIQAYAWNSDLYNLNFWLILILKLNFWLILISNLHFWLILISNLHFWLILILNLNFWLILILNLNCWLTLILNLNCWLILILNLNFWLILVYYTKILTYLCLVLKFWSYGTKILLNLPKFQILDKF